ncbi:MAG: acyl-CoA desaturase [Bacteroidia bacterium]
MLAIILFFIGHWYLSLFTQTFFHHRYSAHRQFTMSRTWERIFFILSYVFQGSSYLSPYAYGVLHRYHHAYADTDKDPHSPKYSKNLMDMMWQTKDKYNDIFNGRADIEDRFKGNLPQWTALDRLADSWFSRIGWAVFYIAFYVEFVPAGMWYLYLLLPIHFVMGPFHGAIINWFAHKWGYVSHKVSDTSKNLLFFDFLMLGESYHNNHHRHPMSPNFGIRWHEFDPIYPVIKIFNALGIIVLKKPVQERLRKAA